MKYLICEDFGGQPIPFLFPEKVAHADMREQLPYTKVLSAGYIALEQGKFLCSGGDRDLEVSSRPGDAAFIEGFFSGGTA